MFVIKCKPFLLSILVPVLIGFISGMIILPVSYTHLDVYKRQAKAMPGRIENIRTTTNQSAITYFACFFCMFHSPIFLV